MIEKKFELTNKSGLHARPASKFCAIARSFHCNIKVKYDDQVIDAKRILDLMAANLKRGMVFQVECDGSDENQAIVSLSSFVEALDD